MHGVRVFFRSRDWFLRRRNSTADRRLRTNIMATYNVQLHYRTLPTCIHAITYVSRPTARNDLSGCQLNVIQRIKRNIIGSVFDERDGGGKERKGKNRVHMHRYPRRAFRTGKCPLEACKRRRRVRARVYVQQPRRLGPKIWNNNNNNITRRPFQCLPICDSS
jgi:hypothetical protein